MWRLAVCPDSLLPSLPVTTPLTSSDSAAPTGDQQEHTITIPDESMDDRHGDQSLGPARPSSPTHNGSVSVSEYQEDNQCPSVSLLKDNDVPKENLDQPESKYDEETEEERKGEVNRELTGKSYSTCFTL